MQVLWPPEAVLASIPAPTAVLMLMQSRTGIELLLQSRTGTELLPFGGMQSRTGVQSRTGTELLPFGGMQSRTGTELLRSADAIEDRHKTSRPVRRGAKRGSFSVDLLLISYA